MYIAVKYASFAAAATSVNLALQWIYGLIHDGPWSLYAGIAVGTCFGMLAKYYLDKKYIFHYVSESRAGGLKAFIFYAITGVITTAVFWGFEIAFHFIFPQEVSRYPGAVLGLAIGYTAKYFLDKRYVFS